jgi:hypothetical protein
MMQSCASAAKLRGSGPNLHSGFESHGFDVGSPLPRIHHQQTQDGLQSSLFCCSVPLLMPPGVR